MKSRMQNLMALAAGFTLALIAQPALAAKEAGPWDSAAGNPSEMVFAAVGDSIIMRRLSASYQPNTGKMIDLLRKADVAVTNFETGVHGFDIPGSQESGGTYMNSPPFATEELEWAGFDLVSLANNHGNDFGIEGLVQTMNVLNKSKLVWAGAGTNLALARKPGYLDTPKGRVAFISVTASYPTAIAAGPQRKDMPGRPGINPLAHSTTYTVTQETFNTLKALAGGGAPSQFDSASSGGDKSLTWAGSKYVVGSPVGMSTKADPHDLAEIVASVKDAKQMADWVVVAIHCHDALTPGEKEKPPEYLVEFAHAVIDAGADEMMAHGPHMLRGIEVYKGKPVLYSLGNFIMENDLVELQPQDNYDKVGLPDSALPGDYYTKRTKNDTIGFPADRRFWQSVVAETVFADDHTLKSIRLHPISMGFGNKARSRRGQPYPAPDAEAKQIFDDIKGLSAPYGTTIENKGGVFVVSWKK